MMITSVEICAATFAEHITCCNPDPWKKTISDVLGPDILHDMSTIRKRGVRVFESPECAAASSCSSVCASWDTPTHAHAHAHTHTHTHTHTRARGVTEKEVK
jgi:hypothetical protein